MFNDLLFFILFLIVLGVCYIYVILLKKYKEKCIDGEHNWIFHFNSKGSTADLGFGIKNNWNINHYYCSKCLKNKEEDI